MRSNGRLRWREKVCVRVVRHILHWFDVLPYGIQYDFRYGGTM